ncbi:MAG TPA: DUF5675 family protein [Flavobacteriales bacterium]|nr:DUF5675 family protein [Flavobacteriales bacterium]
MDLILQRNVHSSDYTLGEIRIAGKFECYTLEDEYREVKVKGETRIPKGTYVIKLRKVGGFHAKYLKRFGAAFHKGMLHVTNVPGFEYILIHLGNTEKDTAGCVLVGASRDIVKGTIGGSEIAYRRLYLKVLKAIEAGEVVRLIVG